MDNLLNLPVARRLFRWLAAAVTGLTSRANPPLWDGVDGDWLLLTPRAHPAKSEGGLRAETFLPKQVWE